MYNSIYEDYKDVKNIGEIAIVPIKDFEIYSKWNEGAITIYPKGTIKTSEINKYSYNFEFEEMKEEFFDNALIVFPIEYTRENIIGTLRPQKNKMLLKAILSKAEDIINIFRYVYCNFEMNSNLPQQSGYIKENISGILVYSPRYKKSDFIIEKYITPCITIGNGLHIEECNSNNKLTKYFNILGEDCGEIGSILKHAFRLYSNILYSTNPTNKFMQAISLVEYLANPFEYEKMQKVKTKIAPYSADSKKGYSEICERFRQLTSLKNDKGEEIGLRTLIVHNGKSIEEILNEPYEIDLILRELQGYICKFIEAIIEDYKEDWEVVKTRTEHKLMEIEKIKTCYDGKVEVDVAIIIDVEFINKAIQEVYQIYPQCIDRKFNLTLFLQLLLEQTDLQRLGYQIPVHFVYKEDGPIYNCLVDKKISELEGLGFDSEVGEISIYTVKRSEQYDMFLETLINVVIKEKNCILEETTKYNNIIFVSDRNRIGDDVFIKANKSHKRLYLGRLDNKRTTCFDECKWFDVQSLIIQCLDIKPTEEYKDNFIFTLDEARYPNA